MVSEGKQRAAHRVNFPCPRCAGPAAAGDTYCKACGMFFASALGGQSVGLPGLNTLSGRHLEILQIIFLCLLFGALACIYFNPGLLEPAWQASHEAGR